MKFYVFYECCDKVMLVRNLNNPYATPKCQICNKNMKMIKEILQERDNDVSTNLKLD